MQQILDRIETVDDRVASREGALKPGAQQATAHRGAGEVDFREQRAAAAPLGALENLQMVEGGRVDDEVIRPRAEREGPEVFQIGPLGVAQMLNEASCRLDRSGMFPRIEAEPLQRRRAELFQQGPPRAFEVEEPGLDAGDGHGDLLDPGQGRRVEVIGQEYLPRADGGQIVHGRACRRGSAVLGDLTLPGGQVGRGEAEDGLLSPAATCDRRQERGLARLQRTGGGERSRGNHSHDLATNDSARLARVLHLLAHGDPKALPDQTSQIGVGRVPRHAAHRDLVAAAILRARREGQLQRRGGGHRILVEQLVEVTHPEEEQRIGVLPLGLQVLAHRRGRPPHRGGRDLDVGRHRARW